MQSDNEAETWQEKLARAEKRNAALEAELKPLVERAEPLKTELEALLARIGPLASQLAEARRVELRIRIHHADERNPSILERARNVSSILNSL